MLSQATILWLNSTPESWLNMQTAYDLWQAKQKQRPQILPARLAHA